MTPAEIEALLDRLSGRNSRNNPARIKATGEDSATLEMQVGERHLRIGGTVSGPALMFLADYAMYAALFAAAGPRAMAVTTNLNMNFLRKTGPGAIVAEARIIKLGRKLAFGEVNIHPKDDGAIIAHATCTYALPSADASGGGQVAHTTDHTTDDTIEHTAAETSAGTIARRPDGKERAE